MVSYPQETQPQDTHSKVSEMRHYLKDARIQADLQNRLASVPDLVTTSIRDAALVARMSEAQLRYSETKGLLTPKRSLEAPLDPDGHKGQRRYSLSELRRLVVIGKLLETYSPNDVALFIDAHEANLQDVIETRQTPLFERVFIAEQTVFQRFLVPRLLYNAIALLLENTIDGEVGVFIPVRDTPEALTELADVIIMDTDHLDILGRSLIGWHSQGRPFSAFLNEPPVLDNPGNFRVTPLSSLIDGDELMRGATAPIAVHLAYAQTMETALMLASNDARQRQADSIRSREGDPFAAPRPPADPRAVAARLLWLAQQTPSDQSPQSLQSLERAQGERADDAATGDLAQQYTRYAIRQRNTGLAPYPALWRSIFASSDSMVYTAPEFSDPLLGDSQLTYLAETVVRLGGATATGDPRWPFACILEPLDRNAPAYQRELVVRAQTARSPYKLGVTRTPSNPRLSLSTHAYQSRVSVYRSALVPGDQAVSLDDVEHARSAIAMPLEGKDGGVVGVLYVAGADEDAFDQNDHLLLRILGRFMGELLVAYQTRSLSQGAIAAMIAAPESIVPGQSFGTENDFVRDLERQLSPDAPPADSLSFVAVDLNDQGRVVAAYSEEIGQLLTQEVGRRITEQSRLQFNQPDTFRRYRAYADRFYILLRNVSGIDARTYAYQLREALGGSYQIRGDVVIPHVTVRVATITYDMQQILALGASTGAKGTVVPPLPGAARHYANVVHAHIARTLDEALILAKHTSAKNIITWDAEQRRLVEWSPAPTTPLIAAELLTRLANAPENSQEALVYKMLTNLMNK